MQIFALENDEPCIQVHRNDKLCIQAYCVNLTVTILKHILQLVEKERNSNYGVPSARNVLAQGRAPA